MKLTHLRCRYLLFHTSTIFYSAVYHHSRHHLPHSIQDRQRTQCLTQKIAKCNPALPSTDLPSAIAIEHARHTPKTCPAVQGPQTRLTTPFAFPPRNPQSSHPKEPFHLRILSIPGTVANAMSITPSRRNVGIVSIGYVASVFLFE